MPSPRASASAWAGSRRRRLRGSRGPREGAGRRVGHRWQIYVRRAAPLHLRRDFRPRASRRQVAGSSFAEPSVSQPFHFAFFVRDLASTRRFYGEVLGCQEGRSTDTWVDFDFFGNQISAHTTGSVTPTQTTGKVEDLLVPRRPARREFRGSGCRPTIVPPRPQRPTRSSSRASSTPGTSSARESGVRVSRAAVAIVGGGVMGASVAYHLAARGQRDVLILDRGQGPGEGSTGRATGGYRAAIRHRGERPPLAVDPGQAAGVRAGDRRRPGVPACRVPVVGRNPGGAGSSARRPRGPARRRPARGRGSRRPTTSADSTRPSGSTASSAAPSAPATAFFARSSCSRDISAPRAVKASGSSGGWTCPACVVTATAGSRRSRHRGVRSRWRPS